MTAKQAEAAIKRMTSLERTAQDLNNRLGAVEMMWNDIRRSGLLDTPEYAAYCERTGKAQRYTFGDMIC